VGAVDSALRKATTVLWTITVVWLGTSVAADFSPQRSRSVDEAALARDYVLAACLIHRYQGSTIAAEAEVWAQGLVEQGGVKADVYSQLADLARRTAPEPRLSKAGTPMLMQSCVQLYNSQALQVQIRRLLRR
jgi:hypothetical protein